MSASDTRNDLCLLGGGSRAQWKFFLHDISLTTSSSRPNLQVPSRMKLWLNSCQRTPPLKLQENQWANSCHVQEWDRFPVAGLFSYQCLCATSGRGEEKKTGTWSSNCLGRLFYTGTLQFYIRVYGIISVVPEGGVGPEWPLFRRRLNIYHHTHQYSTYAIFRLYRDVYERDFRFLQRCCSRMTSNWTFIFILLCILLLEQ